MKERLFPIIDTKKQRRQDTQTQRVTRVHDQISRSTMNGTKEEPIAVSNDDKTPSNVSIYKRHAVDETSHKYDAYTRLQLAARVTQRRERLLIFVTDYILETVNSDTFNLIEGRTHGLIDASILKLLKNQQTLRNNELYIRKYTTNVARNFTVEQLNELLFYYDEVYRDAIDLVDLTVKTGIALKAPVEDTIRTFLEILRVVLIASPKCN